MSIKNMDNHHKNKYSNGLKRHIFDYGKFYLSQGFKNAKIISNDCGPTTIAMTINILLDHINLKTLALDKDTIIKQSNFKLWDRIPEFIPIFGGATAPWGIARAFNYWMMKLAIPWRAHRKSHASRLDILENLLSGNMVTALKIWKNPGAHWINIVSISTEKDMVYLLDPNPYLIYLAKERRIQSEPWEKFARDWGRQSWWTRLFRLKNEIIYYKPKTEY